MGAYLWFILGMDHRPVVAHLLFFVNVCRLKGQHKG